MIFVEDNTIKLNGVVLPGLVKSIEVKESAQIDEQEVEGSSAKPKQATGYEDAKINIELVVDDTDTQTKYQRLETLRAVFRKEGQGVPQPIPIVCEDAAAHGIDKVLFKSLNHKAEQKKSYFSVTLELWEYIPQTIQAVKSSGTSSGKKSGQLRQRLGWDIGQQLLQLSQLRPGRGAGEDHAGAAEEAGQVPCRG